MVISNFGFNFKILPKVEFRQFLHMHSGKLATNTWNCGPISKTSQLIGNLAQRTQIWSKILKNGRIGNKSNSLKTGHGELNFGVSI